MITLIKIRPPGNSSIIYFVYRGPRPPSLSADLSATLEVLSSLRNAILKVLLNLTAFCFDERSAPYSSIISVWPFCFLHGDHVTTQAANRRPLIQSRALRWRISCIVVHIDWYLYPRTQSLLQWIFTGSCSF